MLLRSVMCGTAKQEFVRPFLVTWHWVHLRRMKQTNDNLCETRVRSESRNSLAQSLVKPYESARTSDQAGPSQLGRLFTRAKATSSVASMRAAATSIWSSRETFRSHAEIMPTLVNVAQQMQTVSGRHQCNVRATGACQGWFVTLLLGQHCSTSKNLTKPKNSEHKTDWQCRVNTTNCIQWPLGAFAMQNSKFCSVCFVLGAWGCGCCSANGLGLCREVGVLGCSSCGGVGGWGFGIRGKLGSRFGCLACRFRILCHVPCGLTTGRVVFLRSVVPNTYVPPTSVLEASW